MLKVLRKKGLVKKLLWIVAIVIIISFGFFGSANYLIQRDNRAKYRFAGSIYGKKILFTDYQTAYRNTTIQALLKYGENFYKIRQFLNLESETWDRLILLHEAKLRDIRVDDAEVINTIETTPFFQKDGQFDSLLYNNILRNYIQMTPRDFEEHIRDMLTVAELVQQETNQVTVSEEEIFEAYKLANEKVRISYTLTTPEDYKQGITITEEEVKEYYDQNAPKFFVPESVNVHYLEFPFPPSKGQQPRGLKAVQSENENELKVVPDNDALPNEEIDEELAEQMEEIRLKADSVYEQIQNNSDLKALASKNNLVLKESGFINTEKPDFKLGWSFEQLKTIFQLEPDNITGPFETAKGVYIVQMKEKRKGYVPTLEEANEKVKQSVILEKARKITEEKTKEALNVLMEKMNQSEEKDFSKTAKNIGLLVYKTPQFKRGQYLPVIGISKDFQDAAFKLSSEYRISGVVSTEKGYSILHLDEYIPIDQEEYLKAKAETEQSLMEEKQSQVFSTLLTRLRQEAQLVNNIEKWRQEEEAKAKEDE